MYLGFSYNVFTATFCLQCVDRMNARRMYLPLYPFYRLFEFFYMYDEFIVFSAAFVLDATVQGKKQGFSANKKRPPKTPTAGWYVVIFIISFSSIYE